MGSNRTTRVEAESKGADREYGLSKATIAVWDLSQDPDDNSDRSKKMPKMGDATPFGSIVESDEDTLASYIGDGFIKGKKPSKRFLNPDNLALRFTEKDGKGKKSHWDLRLSVDDVHKDHERDNLSTMFVDQCDRQKWAWARDLFKIRNTEATLDHDELAFTDAGFLWALKEKGAKNMTRAALYLNVSRRGGGITDGVLDAAWWHVGHISKGSKISKPLQSGPGQTQSDPNPGPGSTQAGGCGAQNLAVGTVRGDFELDLAGFLSHFVVKGKYTHTRGRRMTGHLFIDKPSPTPPLRELADEAAVSNQKVVPRKTHNGLWVVVFDDDWPAVPTPGAVPPDFPDKPGTVDTPTQGTHGSYTPLEFASTGNDIGVAFTLGIPESVQGGLNVDVNIILPDVASSGDIDTQLDYVVQGLGEDSPLTATSLNDTLAAGAGGAPGRNVISRILFYIPASALNGKGGGKLSCAFYRSGIDGQADTLKVISINYQFGSEAVS